MIIFKNELPGMALNMPVLSDIPMSRYFSSLKHELFPFCSLPRLAYDVGIIYSCLSDLFPELTVLKVSDIQKRIRDGRYTLSPLVVRYYSNEDQEKPVHKFHILDEPNFYLGVNPTPEDRLVLMALGRMLNLNFIRENLLMENCFGLRVRVNEFYDTLCARGSVLRLFKLDLTNSLKTLNRNSLLYKLSHIVKDGAIMELVGQFLYLPIMDEESGRDFTADIGCSIPSSPLIAEALLHFALTDFDKEFPRLFTGLSYCRYIHEVFVSFPKTCTSSSKTLESEDIFEQQVLSLFDRLNLEGQIVSIVPGDAPVPCFYGHVCVSEDGEMKYQKYKYL